MALFGRSEAAAPNSGVKDFDYLKSHDIYMDSACQTLRPRPVLDAMQAYYQEYNACGGRVKYAWGRRVDTEIARTRQAVLDYVGKSPKQYLCAFTLNTTYGLNLLLGQLPSGTYRQIITSDIEHNSVFLSTMAAAKRLDLPRRVITRLADGSLPYSATDLKQAIVVVNATSNIDGRPLKNIDQLAKDIRRQGGLLIIDAAQTMAHDPALLKKVPFDALCFSGHKVYGPSIGGMVLTKQLHGQLDFGFIGGGTVEDVQKDSYTLTRDDLASHLEPGLQDFAGIIGLGAALTWLKSPKREDERALAKQLYDGLKTIPSVTIINESPAPIVSFYTNKIDAHRLAVFLSAQGIMARSGYFCCHYYLHHEKQYPPLLRLSLGLNNTAAQVDYVLTIIKKILGEV